MPTKGIFGGRQAPLDKVQREESLQGMDSTTARAPYNSKARYDSTSVNHENDEGRKRSRWHLYSTHHLAEFDEDEDEDEDAAP